MAAGKAALETVFKQQVNMFIICGVDILSHK